MLIFSGRIPDTVGDEASHIMIVTDFRVFLIVTRLSASFISSWNRHWMFSMLLFTVSSVIVQYAEDCCSTYFSKISWEEFHLVGTSWTSVFSPCCSNCCFLFNTLCPVVLLWKKVTIFLIFSWRWETSCTPSPFWPARLIVCANHPICGFSPAFVTALTCSWQC